MAATGKGEGAAKNDGMRAGDAGEIIAYLLEQSPDIGRLLDPETNRRYHLCEIKAAPSETWQLLTGLLVEFTWSVKDIKAAGEKKITADLVQREVDKFKASPASVNKGTTG